MVRRGFQVGALLLLLALSACGFQLKQSQELPFTTLYTNINQNNSFGAQLYRVLQANSPELAFVSSPEAADAQLLQLQHDRRLRELSLDPSGDVENYELNLTMEFTVIDNQDNTLLAPFTLRAVRDIPNNPDSSHAKRMEIDRLFDSMELSLVNRLLNRLGAIAP